MNIPFRAAGTFAGVSYIEREADSLLRDAIYANQRYPYIVAPRQSGKSSLLFHIRRSLDPQEFTDAFVDLSTFELSGYDDFWRALLEEIADSAGLNPADIFPRRPENSFIRWLSSRPQRLVIFVDEIDALLGASFREQFFSKLRSLFNKRAERPILERLTIVLAGAAHPTQLISDRSRSPFNVGIEIALDCLTPDRVAKMVSLLQVDDVSVGTGVSSTIFEETSGSVFLCQSLLELLWPVAQRQGSVSVEDVEKAIQAIVAGAHIEMHFQNIYNLTISSPTAVTALRQISEGLPIDDNASHELRIIGLSDGTILFRNKIYRRVFGVSGPLSLAKILGLPPTEISGPTQVRNNGLPTPEQAILKTAKDEDLLILFRKGSGKAGQMLSKRYMEEGLRFATLWSRHTTRDAEDLVQQALIRSLYGEGRPGVLFRPLFFATLRNMLVTSLRARRSLTLTDDTLEHIVADSDFPELLDQKTDIESLLEKREYLSLLTSALENLPLDEQIIIKLVFWDEMALREISALMGLSNSLVHNRFRRGLAALSFDVGDLFTSDLEVNIATWLKRIDLEIQRRYHE